MALTKVTKSGITDNAVDADKIEDGTVLAADLANGAVTADKLASTLDISSKTVTLPNTSVTNAMLAGSIANDKLANSAITVNGASISLGGSVSAGSIEWQTVKTSGFTAVAGEGYFCNTNGGAFIATLPASPSAGDTVAFKDYGDDFATNALTIARNGENIQGVANNSEITTDRASIVLVYIDATKGWLYTNESNVADLQQALFISATGGTVITTGDFKVHAFTGDGNFVVANTGNSPSVPTGGPANVDYFVVAGGGNGTISGGGGGGFRTSYPSPNTCAGVIPVTGQTYPITVGAGGGNDSIFSTITSTGGGAGRHYVHPDGIGEPGGSGGGGARASGTAAGGSGNTPPVSPPQGNNGGPSGPSSQITGGGGGGAQQGGGTGPGCGGNGAPIADAFFGPTAPSYGTPGPSSGRYFAGGGGGSLHQPGEGNKGGGAGGGGTGYPGGAPAPGDGGTNTGGGAGGATQPGGQSKNGGSGAVFIRYKFQ